MPVLSSDGCSCAISKGARFCHDEFDRFRQRSRTTQMVCPKKDRATLRWPEMPVAVVEVGGSDEIRTHGGGKTPTAVYSSYGRCSDRWFKPLTHTSVNLHIAQFSVISRCLVSGTCILPEKFPLRPTLRSFSWTNRISCLCAVQMLSMRGSGGRLALFVQIYINAGTPCR